MNDAHNPPNLKWQVCVLCSFAGWLVWLVVATAHDDDGCVLTSDDDADDDVWCAGSGSVTSAVTVIMYTKVCRGGDGGDTEGGRRADMMRMILCMCVCVLSSLQALTLSTSPPLDYCCSHRPEPPNQTAIHSTEIKRAAMCPVSHRFVERDHTASVVWCMGQ